MNDNPISSAIVGLLKYTSASNYIKSQKFLQ